jgi:hypothetical protein
MKIIRGMERLHLASTINKLLNLIQQINQWNRSCFHCLKNLFVNFLKNSSLVIRKVQIIHCYLLAKIATVIWLYLSMQIFRNIAGLIHRIVTKLHQGFYNIKVNI